MSDGARASSPQISQSGLEARAPGATLEAIDHVQLAMPRGEEEAARRFYGSLLGLPERPKPPELARRGGCWFESDAVKVHLGVEDPFRPARKAHIAFSVADVAALAARARDGGFEVVDDEALPGHERIYIYDPFGNRLEFLRPLS
ncbi:MAG TPA: VOC family protein [Caulobacteraceae bacterium]|nr:VOC family protein [Caulobacteraceae bacterium]